MLQNTISDRIVSVVKFSGKEGERTMSEQHAHKEANAGPLGLLGFGMTTVLLNLHNVGIMPMSVVILAMGIMVGGFAQIVAGIMEFKAGNTFSATAFCAYGSFWWSLVLILVNPSALGAEAADGTSMGFYMILWAAFTVFMFIGTVKANHATQIIFGTLIVLFVLLAIENFTGSHPVGVAAGVVGIICGAAAIYTSVANIVDGEFNKPIMPM